MSLEPQKTSRIEIIDILRGFALLGISMVHFVEQYYAGQTPDVHADMITKNLGDEIASGLVGFLAQGKFYMIFSFLFGLSFFIQLEKSDGSASFIVRFAWRLVVLFLIGLLHQIHYRGDILTIYAVLGFVLLLSYRLPDRWLLIIALLLIANIPSMGFRLYNAITESTRVFFSNDQAVLLAYFDTMKTGDYLSIVKANWKELATKWEFQFFFGRVYITAGLFLLGLLVGRRKFFERWHEQIPVVRHLFKTSLWTILGSVLFSTAFFGGAQALKIEMSQNLQFAVGGLVMDVFNACLATFYVTGILLLYQKEKWQKRFRIFYSMGRMGLTTYLMQALFGVLIFSSIGLGLLGDIGAMICLAIGLIVFVFQVYFSQWWLSRFRYGFFEWVWRSATYLKWQEFRK